MWNLTGGVDGGVHVTDVTNASRTLLMNIRTLEWDPQIAADMGIPMSMLPEIKSSSEVYGYGRPTGLMRGTPHCRYSGRSAGGNLRAGLL